MTRYSFYHVLTLYLYRLLDLLVTMFYYSGTYSFLEVVSKLERISIPTCSFSFKTYERKKNLSTYIPISNLKIMCVSNFVHMTLYLHIIHNMEKFIPQRLKRWCYCFTFVRYIFIPNIFHSKVWVSSNFLCTYLILFCNYIMCYLCIYVIKY